MADVIAQVVIDTGKEQIQPGDPLNVSSEEADRLISIGAAVSAEDQPTAGADSDLPEDVPAREVLVAAGVSEEQLWELFDADDLTSIEGVGKGRAAEIAEYLKSVDDEGGEEA